MDDPMDEYYWGRAAEIFEYRLVGVSGTQSGGFQWDVMHSCGYAMAARPPTSR
jgi:hypothetical protein